MSETNNIFTRLSWFRQERVAAAHVMVVGCGALGNEVLKNLALFGVGHIVIVDFDCVEPSNLSRSVLFTREDAAEGRQKAAVAAERIRQMNPDVDVRTICGDIAYDVGLGLIRQMDVIIGCVDNRWARYCINRLAMRAGKPWVDGGIDSLEGTARVFMPGKNCYACNLGPEGLQEMQRRFSCAHTIRMNEAAGRVPTTPVIASVIGAVQTQEAMKLIHREQLEKGELTGLCGHMFCYEGQHLTTRTVDFLAYDEDCPVHEQWTPVTASELTNGQRIREVLDAIRTMLHTTQVRISLSADSFVDKLVRRDDNRSVTVMLPKHKVSAWWAQHKPWTDLPVTECYVNEYNEIDEHFPYQELTLSELGIPVQDILWVHTDTGDQYIELKR